MDNCFEFTSLNELYNIVYYTLIWGLSIPFELVDNYLKFPSLSELYNIIYQSNITVSDLSIIYELVHVT